MKNLPKIAQSRSDPRPPARPTQPASFLPLWTLFVQLGAEGELSDCQQGEVCLWGGGQVKPPPTLIICGLTVCCQARRLSWQPCTTRSGRVEMYETLRGEGSRDFPVCEQHGCLLLRTMVNVIGYFFVFFFTCTVHKNKI